MAEATLRVVVLIGGSGSNLQALIDNQNTAAQYEIVGVISHNPDVFGLTRAQNAGIPTTLVNHRDFADRAAFEDALITAIHQYQPDLICLAGFMRILSAHFVNNFASRILNIHPALLPKFPGLNTHERAIAANETEHGATVHYVTADLDAGPMIAQVRLAILPNEDIASLQQRTLKAEHWLYPQVVSWIAQKRLSYDGKLVTLDSKPLGAWGLAFTLPNLEE